MKTPRLTQQLIWHGRFYRIEEHCFEILLFSDRRTTATYRLVPVKPGDEYNFVALSTKTDRRQPGIFHRYLVGKPEPEPNPYPSIPRWYSPHEDAPIKRSPR